MIHAVAPRERTSVFFSPTKRHLKFPTITFGGALVVSTYTVPLPQLHLAGGSSWSGPRGARGRGRRWSEIGIVGDLGCALWVCRGRTVLISSLPMVALVRSQPGGHSFAKGSPELACYSHLSLFNHPISAYTSIASTSCRQFSCLLWGVAGSTLVCSSSE